MRQLPSTPTRVGYPTPHSHATITRQGAIDSASACAYVVGTRALVQLPLLRINTP